MSNIRNYWSLESRVDRIKDVMTRNEFEINKNRLHFDNDNFSGQSTKDLKFNSILENFNSVANKLTLDEHFSVDEQMIPTKIKKNKTGTSQVGAISKAQKAQNIFLEKNLKFSKKNFSFRKCRTVPKNVKGGPFLIYKHAFCSKITNNSKGGPFGDNKKISKKSRTVPKKNRKGGEL